MVFGLGEANRGINKRGFLYISDCADDPNHVESKTSLYAAHNFIIISGKTHVGFFFDYPGTLRFDIGYTTSDTMTVSCENADLYVYMITGDSDLDIVNSSAASSDAATLLRSLLSVTVRAAGATKQRMISAR